MKIIKTIGVAVLTSSLLFTAFTASAHNRGKPISKVKDCKALKNKKKAAACKKCVTKPGKHHYHPALRRCHLISPKKKAAKKAAAKKAK